MFRYTSQLVDKQTCRTSQEVIGREKSPRHCCYQRDTGMVELGGFGSEAKFKCFPFVDGSEIRLSPVEMVVYPHCLQGLIHVRWCSIS